ncbi:MAG: ABC transporter ATP-binding protein [Gammaproteobacteria bacterium]|nr:ABC transporter ATP-binding protein [Gammaproteobacteria bacterium]
MLTKISSNVVFEIWKTYRRFVPFVAPDILGVLVDALTIVVAVITNTLMIWLIGMPFDLVQKGQFDAVMEVLFWFAVVIVVNQAMQLIGSWLTQWLGLRSIGRIRNAVLTQLVQVSFPAANRWSKGDLLARLGNDVDSIKSTIVDAPLYILSHILTATIYISMLFWIDYALALVALAVTPLFIIYQRILGSRKRHAAEQFVAKRGDLISFEEEALSNLRGISSANAEGFITRLHHSVFEIARHWAMKERVVDICFMVGFSFLIYVTGLAIVFLGLDGIRAGRFGAGHLVSFLLFLGYLTVPARGLADIVFQALGNFGAAKRVLEVLYAQPLVSEVQDARDVQKLRGSIAIEDVSFSYPGSTLLYDRINLHIATGETIALVGPSGCGKSTLALLLLRFYDVTSGRILIDGIDVRTIRLEALRRNVAIVWQEPYVVSGTLRENLLMYAPEASEAELMTACSASRAWDFIEQLPQKLDARIGVGGTSLSTGQKQRIAIAQAFLRDAPILIMDEATSALDSQSEQAISAAMNKLCNGRTTILIAHRYSSLKSADRVAYFNGDGTLTVDRHDRLLESHPGYKGAVEWQTGRNKQAVLATK